MSRERTPRFAYRAGTEGAFHWDDPSQDYNSDPRSLGSQHIKGIDKSTLGNDSSVPSMLHGPSDLWSLILVGIFPKERIVALKVKARDVENLFTFMLHPFQKKGAYAKATFGCEIVNIWNKS